MEFEIPESLDGLTAEQINDLVAKARETAATFGDIPDADFTDSDLEDLEKLAGFITEGETKSAEIAEAEATAAAERAERLNAARAAITKPEETDETPAEDAPAEEEATETTDAPAEDEAKEPVMASAPRKVKARSVAAKAAAVAPKIEMPNGPAASITAAADVPGFATGSSLQTLDDVAEGFIARYAAMPKGKVGSVQNHYGVANIAMGRSDDLMPDNYRSLQDMLQAASKESRLPGGSLTAAGGWCAPSETVYDLCTIESTDGLLDIATINAPRGGLQFTKGPDFADFYAYVATAFQTEAEAEAGAVKTCIEVECPPFEDVRLDAAYACIKAGILTEAGYPELIRRYIEGVLIAQRHAVAARMIAEMEAITGPAIPVGDVFPNAISILDALELVAEGERQRYRMARSATLEVILPLWMRAAIRADLANRTGVEMTNVTDQMIDAHFGTRGLRVQFIYNYQELDVDTNGIATDYPTTVEMIMYPAGTFVMLTNDVIRLDAIYDSVGLETNTYTAMFAEEGIALANVCNEPRRLSIDFCVSGRTGAADISQCFGQAAV